MQIKPDNMHLKSVFVLHFTSTPQQNYHFISWKITKVCFPNCLQQDEKRSTFPSPYMFSLIYMGVLKIDGALYFYFFYVSLFNLSLYKFYVNLRKSCYILLSCYDVSFLCYLSNIYYKSLKHYFILYQ